MFDKSSLPVVEFKRLPPLFCLSAGALLGLLVVAFVIGERSQQKQESLLNEYGTALAQISAQEVVEESISSDLVSMHAIMQRVVAQPRVLRAAVHDLDQQLLVQAGQSTLHGYISERYSAPIPLREGAAGTVTVTMNVGFPGESAVRWALAGTCVLLLIMAALALYETRGTAWYFRPRGEERANDEDQQLVDELTQEARPYFAENDAEKEEPAPADAPANEANGFEASVQDEAPVLPPEPEVMHCDLILALPNRARLEQLLNSERFLALTNQLDQAVEDVLSLYGGENVGENAEASMICTRFTSDKCIGEAAFRSVCSAHLIGALTSGRKMHLQLVAEVRHPMSDAKLAVADAGVFVQSALADEYFSARIDAVEADGERLRLVGFRGSYQALLDRQQAQLQSS